ncbi:MAG: hypothetical protein JKY37_17510 [Nannocystaceae bacterium]|nr:hypothetical protein [Nannocystaceae bacterium]
MPQLSLVFIAAAGVAVALSWMVPPRASAAYQAAVGSALLLWLDPISLPVLLVLTAALHFTTRQQIRFRGRASMRSSSV